MSTSTHVTQTLSTLTGYGLELCKIALERSKNDITAAKRLLEKWSLKTTDQAPQALGAVTTYFDPALNSAVIIEARCDNETVASSRDFYEVVRNCAIENIQHEHHHTEEPKIAKLEQTYNCTIRINSARMVKSNPFALLTTYTHRDTIGTMIETEVTNEAALAHRAFKVFSWECAMHVAAFNPFSVDKTDIPPNLIQDLTTQIEKELGRDCKPLTLWPGIVKGKLDKWSEQHSMLHQIWIKSDKDTVGEIKKRVEEKIGSEIKINRFSRLVLGG